MQQPLIIFSSLATFCSMLYCISILFLRRGLNISKIKQNSNELNFSIIIAARNEEKQLPLVLNTICNQTLQRDRYEIIIVNDRSDDNTESICKSYVKQFQNVKTITISQTPHGISPKKYAVSQGICKAKNEIIVFTDADCYVKKTWLETINANFSPQVGLVQGITTYRKTDNISKILFMFQAVDFLSHGIISAAAIGAKLPINSNANNFAFRKEIFNDINGYDDFSQVISGDDDLLLQKVYLTKKWRIIYMFDPKGAVETIPCESWKAVFEQRKRWGSKTVHYSFKQRILLSAIFLFYCITLVTMVSAIFFSKLWLHAILLLLIKIAGELLLMIPGTALFNKKNLRVAIIPASLIQLPMVLLAIFMGVFGKFTWKQQKFSRTTK